MAKSLDSILEEFDVTVTPSNSGRAIKDGGPVSVWLTPEYKKAYEELQSASRGRFIKKVREILMATIDHAKAKAS